MASQHNDDKGDKGDDWDDEFRMKMKKKQGEVQKNELDRYLENDVEDDHVEFYILNWWKLKHLNIIFFPIWLEIYWLFIYLLYHLSLHLVHEVEFYIHFIVP